MNLFFRSAILPKILETPGKGVVDLGFGKLVKESYCIGGL
jgi:hypothetical protein